MPNKKIKEVYSFEETFEIREDRSTSATPMKSLRGCLKGKKFTPFKRENDREI